MTLEHGLLIWRLPLFLVVLMLLRTFMASWQQGKMMGRPDFALFFGLRNRREGAGAWARMRTTPRQSWLSRYPLEGVRQTTQYYYPPFTDQGLDIQSRKGVFPG